MIETIKTAKVLISKGFKVLAYCTDDPVLAKKLENIGCSAIMPWVSYWFRHGNFKSFKY